MMRTALSAALVAVGFVGCAMMPGWGGWTPLFNGTNIDNWNRVGDANWRVEDGAIIADKGTGLLFAKDIYGDFELSVEFFAESDTNSGLFIRCRASQKLTAGDCYEVNIWDDRPKPEYGTGAIVDVARVDPMPKAGGHWNTFSVAAKGDHFVVMLNGVKTAEGRDGKLARGLIGLQHAGGVKNDLQPIKFRKVEIRPL